MSLISDKPTKLHSKKHGYNKRSAFWLTKEVHNNLVWLRNFYLMTSKKVPSTSLIVRRGLQLLSEHISRIKKHGSIESAKHEAIDMLERHR